MVVVDHIGGDPLSKFTYRVFGFSDAAEIFVYLSGMACGLAYPALLERKGWGGLMRVLGTRAVRIYFYYALSSVAIILLVAGADGVWGNEVPIDDYAAGIIQHPDPLTAIWWALSLISPTNISDILVFYIAMTLAAVPILVAGFRYRPMATLAASLLVWALSQTFSGPLLSVGDYWAINPFAWQFLFTIGMFFGFERKSVLSDLPSSLPATAWVIVVSAFLYRIILRASPHLGFDLGWLNFSPSTLVEMKINLSALHLIHFLAVALLVNRYFRPTSPLLQWPLFAPLIQVGARPLEIYSLTVVLSVLAHLVVTIYHPTLQGKILMDGVIFVLMTLPVMVFSRPKMQPDRPPLQPAPPPLEDSRLGVDS
jgi:hypothetical protein